MRIFRHHDHAETLAEPAWVAGKPVSTGSGLHIEAPRAGDLVAAPTGTEHRAA